MKQHGKGRVLGSDGTEYIGYYKRGHLHGPGRLIYSDGDYFQGEFEDGFLSGKGEYSLLGDTYKGNFENGIKEGEGEIKYSNGSSYSGSWHFNKYEN